MQEKPTIARTGSVKPQNAATEAAIQQALQKAQWGRFLQLTRSPATITGTPVERCLRLYLRCHAARMMHDRPEFERNMAAFRREMVRMTAQERAEYMKLFTSGKLSYTYQNPKYPTRPVVTMPATAIERRGMDPEAVDTVRAVAKDTFSDAVYLWHDGKIVLEDCFGAPQEPIPVMSITKPIVAMAIGRLLDTERLRSLDQSVSDFYPEWKKDERKSRITLRHFLTHTSGLPSGEEWMQQKHSAAEIRRLNEDYVSSSRDFVSVAAPGERWMYCNAGLMLLADIAGQAAGRRLDDFMHEEFFAPMGITEFQWHTDKKGNINGAGGLSLRAHDLAKFGVLMLDGGMWKGKRLLSQWFVTESLRDQTHDTRPNGIQVKDAPPMGLIWWLNLEPKQFKVVFSDKVLQNWRRSEVPEKTIVKMMPYKGKVMSKPEYEALVKRLFGLKRLNDRMGWKVAVNSFDYPTIAERVEEPDAEQKVGSFYHSGTAGQEMIVLPGHRVVGVRQIFTKDLSDRGIDTSALSFASNVTDCFEYPITPM
jgi:CubicO group peptidase (beta-lactamase class C family)